MAFVKLDTGILNSTLWMDREARDVFITALLMAEPHEVTATLRQMEVRTLSETGFEIPPGWYGLVRAAGVGIVRQALVDREAGLTALEALGNPDIESRSADFEGRRLVRVDGGFIVLNFVKYRERDNTAAIRSKRWRERVKTHRSATGDTECHRIDRHQEEVEVEAELKPNPPNPPLSRSGGIMTVRDRRRLNDLIYTLMDEHKDWGLERALETAAAQLLLPLDVCRFAVEAAGMGEALKSKKPKP